MTERDRLAILVHEVRSPVAALAAIRETLRDEGLDSGVRSQLVGLVVAACRAIQRIVSDASVASIELEPVDVAQILRDTAAAASLRGARVLVDAPSGSAEVAADPTRIRQVLENLLANALAHTPDDEGIVLALRHESGNVLLSVTDSGPGIPTPEHGRIFEPGVRLGSTYAGSGLGLSIAMAIAEAHGGRLTVDSEPGRGATFTLALPREAPVDRSRQV